MMRGPMMQVLLEDRFRLKIHRETKDVPVYEPTVTADGPKLQPSPPGRCEFFDPRKPPLESKPGEPRRWICGSKMATGGKTQYPGTTLAGFCRSLSLLFDRDVIDKTGIAGFFDIQVNAELVMLPATSTDDGVPPPLQWDRVATFQAFERSLPEVGLRLQPPKAPAVFLVIDHVERPSEN